MLVVESGRGLVERIEKKMSRARSIPTCELSLAKHLTSSRVERLTYREVLETEPRVSAVQLFMEGSRCR